MKKNKQITQRKNVLDTSPSHLLHRVLQIALDIYNDETGEGALTQRQYAVLRAVHDAEALHADGHAGLTQTELVQTTGIDRSTLADMITRMTAKGLLIRVKSTLDARANLVTLSQAGREAITDISPKVAAADEKILSLLSPPKRESFVKLLRKMTYARLSEDGAASKDEARLKSDETTAEKLSDKPVKKKFKKIGKGQKKAKRQKDIDSLPPMSEGADGQQTQGALVVTAPDV
jgi:MarR family transcriptional regulator, temperature-dependent positive regulator of motility